MARPDESTGGGSAADDSTGGRSSGGGRDGSASGRGGSGSGDAGTAGGSSAGAETGGGGSSGANTSGDGSADGGGAGNSAGEPGGNGSAGGSSTGGGPGRDPPAGAQAADWLAASTLRVALTVLGFVILLFAIGQVVGLDLLGIVADALGTRIGRWIVVAFVGVLLIAFALWGFGDGNA